MKLLVDTSVFVRLASSPESLPRAVTDAVDAADQAFLSAASAWEIAIKTSIGKLKLPVSASEYVRSRMSHLQIETLPISSEHAAAVEGLAWHHRDPFDRLLIAQAALEGLTIVTTDRIFAKYGVHVISGKSRRRGT